MNLIKNDQYVKKNDNLLIFSNYIDSLDVNLNFFNDIEHDSIGISWFCKNKIKTDYYLIKDQIHHSSFRDATKQRTINDFLRIINSSVFKDTKKIIVNLNRKNYKNTFEYINWIFYYDKIFGNKIIFNESEESNLIKIGEHDPHKLCFGKYSVYSSIFNIASYYKYKNVFFSEDIFLNSVLMQSENKNTLYKIIKHINLSYGIRFFFYKDNYLKPII